MHVAGALPEQAIERDGALQTLSSPESTLDSRLELPKGPSCARVDDFERFCILLLLESTLPGPRESRLEPHKRDFRPLRVDSSTCRERAAPKSSTRAPLAPSASAHQAAANAAGDIEMTREAEERARVIMMLALGEYGKAA